MAYAADQLGIPEHQLDDWLALRRLDAHEVGTAGTEADLTFIMSIDWARVPRSTSALGLPLDPTVEEIVDELARLDWFPKVDWDATLRPVEELVTEIEACEAEHGVEIPDTMWCSAYVSSQSGDDDWIHYDATVPVDDEVMDYLQFTVDPTQGGESSCSLSQAYLD